MDGMGRTDGSTGQKRRQPPSSLAGLPPALCPACALCSTPARHPQHDTTSNSNTDSQHTHTHIHTHHGRRYVSHSLVQTPCRRSTRPRPICRPQGLRSTASPPSPYSSLPAGTGTRTGPHDLRKGVHGSLRAVVSFSRCFRHRRGVVRLALAGPPSGTPPSSRSIMRSAVGRLLIGSERSRTSKRLQQTCRAFTAFWTCPSRALSRLSALFPYRCRTPMSPTHDRAVTQLPNRPRRPASPLTPNGRLATTHSIPTLPREQQRMGRTNPFASPGGL